MIDVNGRLALVLGVPPEVREAAADLLERLQKGPVALGRDQIRYPGEGGVLLKCGFACKANGAGARTIELRSGVRATEIAGALRTLAQQNSAAPNSAD